VEGGECVGGYGGVVCCGGLCFELVSFVPSPLLISFLKTIILGFSTWITNTGETDIYSRTNTPQRSKDPIAHDSILKYDRRADACLIIGEVQWLVAICSLRNPHLLHLFS